MGMRRKKIAAVLAAAVLLFSAAGCASKASPSVSASVSVTSSHTETSSTLLHSLGLSGVKNARDLGGYRTADGKTVKAGLLLRTAALSDATAGDIKILTGKYHLTQMIDFRTNNGARKNPDPKISGVIETNLPIHTGAGGNLSYMNMVTNPNSISAFRQFFAILLAHKNGAVLFHCAAGKDRTGVASILLLSVLNVEKSTILQDYLLSNKYYSSASSQSECVKGAWVMTLFDTIDRKYGSVDNFLSGQLGLTPQNQAQLKAMYLA